MNGRARELKPTASTPNPDRLNERKETSNFMKTNPPPDGNPPDKLLGHWRVQTPLPPRFQEQVWRRIADAGAVGGITPWAAWRNWLQLAFARPAVAVSCALLLALLGAGTGLWQARQKTAHLDDALGASYVQSVDPYLKTRM